MKLKQEVERELIGLAITAYTAAGTDPARLEKAQALVKNRQVERALPDSTTEKDQSYLVTSSADAGHRYRVTEQGCTCADFATHSQQSPLWDCKHRLSVFLYRQVARALDELVASGIPHPHRYTCGHAEAWIWCWEQACLDGETVRCATCEAVLQEARLLPGLDMTDDSPPLDFFRQQYEPNRSCTDKAIPEGMEVSPCLPLPEAAASLTIKMPLRGGGDMLYTLRGHTDAEVQGRAVGVLGWLRAQQVSARTQA